MDVFRANPAEWEFGLAGKTVFSLKNTHGRKVDTLNLQTNIGLVLLLGFSLLSRAYFFAYFAIFLWSISLLYNAITLLKKHPMHDQEETTMLYELANKFPGLSEPDGEPLESIIEGESLVQPTTRKSTISAKANINKKRNR